MTILALIPMAFYFWAGWLIWAILLRISGMRHPMVEEWPGVTSGRRWLAAVGLLMMVLTSNARAVRAQLVAASGAGDSFQSLRPGIAAGRVDHRPASRFVRGASPAFGAKSESRLCAYHRMWRGETADPEGTGMKIGITCYPTYGGSGVVATELGLELAERGHEVHFISYAQPIRLTGPHPAFTITKWKSRITRCSSIRRIVWRWPRAWRRSPSCTTSICCTCTTPFRTRSARCWRSRCWRPNRADALPFVTTLHGTDITLVGVDRSYFRSPVSRSSRATA